MIDTKNLDLKVNPKDDFYDYACGGWMKANPIPADKARFGTFEVLNEKAREQLRELIDGLDATEDAKVTDTISQKINDIYRMGLDVERRNREGVQPLIPMIDEMQKKLDIGLIDAISWLNYGITGVFFGSGVGPHPEDSNLNIMHITEVGLGLGDRDYYLVVSEENALIMKAYEIYVKRLMELIGKTEEEQQRILENVIKIEKELAAHKMTREDKRNPLNRFNMMSISEMSSRYPAIDWVRYFHNIGIDNLQEANVMSPAFIAFVNGYIPTLSEQEIYDYLLYNLVSDSTGVLSEAFTDANFELYGRVMSGMEEQTPLWKRVMAVPNSMFGEAIGELYVQKHFPEESKTRMKQLVENLRIALGKHISVLTWMSDETKAKALDKLAAFSVKIGYPDKWKDYSEIHIDPKKSYLENVHQAALWFVKDAYSKLGKPVDRDEWHMTPQTVNAYYNPTTNEICFPAAILQPPFFNPAADDAENYGAIGVVIGHEMTHGFDDSGRRFDKNGNLNEWWTAEDAEKFNTLADRLVEQFNKVEVAPGVFANGRFTLGENIADQGGLRVAYTAWQSSRTRENEQKDAQFTPEQSFYLAYANVWAANIRPEEVLERNLTDSHSLGRNRVNVTLRNIEPFFRAFDIKEGDAMYRPDSDRVIIW